MKNIVAFKNSLPPGEVNHELVAEIEALLAQAKSGDLRGIAYAVSLTGNRWGTGWSGADGTRHLLSSGILVLAHRYGAALHEG